MNSSGPAPGVLPEDPAASSLIPGASHSKKGASPLGRPVPPFPAADAGVAGTPTALEQSPT